MEKIVNYHSYLQSDHWKKTRARTILLQGSKCRVCGSSKNINIHHRRYKYNGKSILGREINQTLLPLCQDCHNLWHKLHGLKRIPFPTLRHKLKKGIDKLTAFSFPYKNITTLESYQTGRFTKL